MIDIAKVAGRIIKLNYAANASRMRDQLVSNEHNIIYSYYTNFKIILASRRHAIHTRFLDFVTG